ncbi:MAG: hypothetical protein ACOYNI_02895 [Acidimicrobiia bacterium]
MRVPLRHVVAAVALGGLVILASACTTDPPATPSLPPEIAALPTGCSPLAVRTCGLPFPSDAWTISDDSTPTGRRVVMSDRVVGRRALSELPSTLRPSSVFDGADGFSADTPVILETLDRIDPESLPADGGRAFQVWDTTTGTRVAIRTEPDREANLRGAINSVLTAFPASRFKFGHHYVAVATTALRRADRGPMVPGTRLRNYLERKRSPLAPTLSFLAQRGVDRNEIVAVTDFTVRSRDNLRAPLDAMLDVARRADHPVREVTPHLNFLGIPGVETIVTGQLLTRDFRNTKTGAIDFANPGAGHDDWVDFVATVPTSAVRTPAPVVLYGHGLGIFKESFVLVAGQNAQLGTATIAIDAPNHGSRVAADGGQIFDLLAPKNTDRLIALITQAVVDLASLRRAVETSLTSLDVAPYNFLAPTETDGTADLDTTAIHYQGTSMGSVLGSAYVANDPNLKSALFQVGGVGIMNILTHSALWERNDIGVDKPPFRVLVPKAARPGEAALFTALAQMRLDPGDGINYVDQVAQNGTPTLLAYDANDQIVPNRSSDAFVTLAQLPRNQTPQPGATAAYVVPTDDVTPALHNPIPFLNSLAGLGTHIAFIGGAADLQDQWLRARL